MNTFLLQAAGVGVSTTFPDAIPRIRIPRPTTTLVMPYSAPVESILHAWQPFYPDRTPKPIPVFPGRIGVFGGSIFSPAIAPTSWEPHYPTFRSAPRVHQVFKSFLSDPLSGEQLRIAGLLMWDPRLKAPLVLRPKRARTAISYVTVPSAAIPGTGPGCVEMTFNGFSVPTLLTGSLAAPTLINPALSIPTLLHEDLC